jgi:ubiquinone/menaquinone biosynthesis C-methylase UbiE
MAEQARYSVDAAGCSALTCAAVADEEFLTQLYGSYDEIEEQFQQALDETLHPAGPEGLLELVAGLGLPAGAAAIDVGCGRGWYTFELARRYGFTVLGVDPLARFEEARDDLATALRESADLGGRVSFEPGVAEHLPAGDGSMDLVWCRDVLVHVEELAAAYSEFRRVLRPGGRVVVYQMFGAEQMEQREGEWLYSVLGCVPANMDPLRTEAAIAASGLQTDSCIVIGTQWGEAAEERSGAGGRHLLHAARLLRDPDRYIGRFGRANYDIALADCRWQVYRMMGKLSGRIYLLSAPG